jgi:hypothetical protein
MPVSDSVRARSTSLRHHHAGSAIATCREPADPDAEPRDDLLTALLGLPVHEVGRQRADAQSGFAPGHATDKSSDLIVKQVY